MTITDIFSKRQERAPGEILDVYVYDDIPKALRVQIVHIWLEVLGGKIEEATNHYTQEAYSSIVSTLCKEYGVYHLPPSLNVRGTYGFLTELVAFFEEERLVNRVLDVIELSFQMIDSVARDHRYLNRQNAKELADDAIDTLNRRFQEHGVGYRYADRKILRINSEFLHSEAVLPALALLQGARYKGAQEEFLNAHAHYRAGRHKEAVNECLKAFESVMKAICDKQEWTTSSRATASGLIKTVFDNHLIPSYLKEHYNSLRTMLERGVPTIRNTQGAHGQGAVPISIPDHLVAYTLHMTASSIVFLVECEKALRK